MSLSSYSINKPISILMLYAGLCLFGLISLTRLPVELYPDTSFGQISIIIYIRGGIPPTEVESLVTKPIEEAVSTVSHLKQLLSISKEGESTVVLSFESGTDMQLAAMEVREKFSKVKEKLPKQAEKPVIAQFSQTDVPIVILAVTSRKKTPEELRIMIDEDIKERLKRIKGVANVEIGGGRERKIMVEVDKNSLYRYKVSMNQLINALGANNLNILVGEFEKTRDKLLIRAIGQLYDLDAVKNTVVLSHPDGSVVRVKNLAQVSDSFMEPKEYARINIRPVVSIYIQKESKSNTIEVTRSILKEVDYIRTILPKDIEIITTRNQSEFIKTSIKNLNDSLLRGAVMIILVLMLFMTEWKPSLTFPILGGIFLSVILPHILIYFLLAGMFIFVISSRRYRSVLVVAVSIPISLVVTFGIMDMTNMFVPAITDLTMNVITLFGLALAVGMLVDNSIVVFENIVSKKEQGMDDAEAAETGSTEMNVVIFASTLTTVIVFLPMVFVSDTMKLLYGSLAWVVTFALTISLFVALMIVPLLCSRVGMIDIGADGEKTRRDILVPFYRWQEKALLYVLRRRFLFIGIAFVLFLVAMFLYSRMDKEYLGSTEQNKFTVHIELPTGAKLDASDEIVRKIEAFLKEIPEVKDFTARVEGWSSKIYVNLVSLTQRKKSVNNVMDELRPKVEKLEPAFVYFEEEQEVGTKEIIVNVYGFDYDILREIAIAMTTRMGRVQYFTDTKIRMREGRPELWLKVDKKKGSYFGLSTREVADIVHAKVRGVRATMYHTKSSEIETIVRLQEKDRRTIKDIHMLPLSRRGDDRVTLDQMTDFKYGLGPSEIWRKDRSRMIQVSANIGEISLGRAAKIVDEIFSDLKLPEDYYYEIGGDYDMLLRIQREFTITIAVILILIYLVLASIFESYKQPFIIMITIMFATVGAIGSLYIAKIPLGMAAFIGMMMLAGIVVNNGIILVDHANLLRKKRRILFRILLQASRDRLRPVLMTTGTTIIGLVPMAFDMGEGSNLWRPLAVTVIGGLAFSTLLTLILVPALYSIFERKI